MSGAPQVLLQNHLGKLKLPTFLREYDKLARQCAAEDLDHVRFLTRLVELELIDRERRMVERRIKAPKFPVTKSLDSFDFKAIPSLLIIDELGFVPLSKTGAELLFEVISQRYERRSIIITSNLPFDEWSEVFGSERLTGAILDRLTHHVHILEMNGESFRLRQSRKANT